MLTDYVASLRRRNCSQETIRGYSFKLRLWFRWCDAEGIVEPGAADVEEFLDVRDFGARSRYQYLSTLAMFYKWAIDQGRLESDPTIKIPRPQLPESLPRPISEDLFRLALDRADDDIACMLQLAGRAGLRCREIAGVHGGRDLDLNLEPAVLRVTQPKGRRQRAVPLHPDVVDALRMLGAPRDGFVFPSFPFQNRRDPDYGYPASGKTISAKGNRHLHDCGIGETMHQLRHRFATVLCQKSKNVRMVAEMMGHRDLATTMVYTRVDMDDAARWVTDI